MQIQYGDIKSYQLNALWEKTDAEAWISIRYEGDRVFLHYDVSEPEIRREVKQYNGEVYTDSCVEFFVKRADSPVYMNFEFSASGYCLVGRGAQRPERVRLDEDIIKNIPVNVVIIDDSHWMLDAEIDFRYFELLKDDEHLKDVKFMFNAYKCGDGLRKPHYLALYPISTAKPDFHMKQFFNELTFA